MRGMVLAAGLGTRLRPLTEDVPKPMVPLLGKPLVAYGLELLRDAGITEVVVNLHHRAEVLARALERGLVDGVEVRVSMEPDLLGTAGGVRRVLGWLGEQGTFVVVNGDTVVSVDLPAAVERHRSSGAQATLLLHRHRDARSYGAVSLDRGGRITGIGGLLGPAPGSGLLFAGVHLLEPGLVARLPAGAKGCLVRDLYVPAIREGVPIHGDVSVGLWADLGTPARYLAAHRTLLETPASEPRVSVDGLEVVGPCFVHPSVRVEGRAEVGPFASLEAEVLLADGARVSDVVVWPRTRVEGAWSGGILTPTRWVPVPPGATAGSR